MIATPNRCKEIENEIKQFAGMVDGRLDGMSVYFSVKEMHERAGSSVYRTRPSGRFQINVSVPGQNRQAIFRTKKKDGTYNIADVVDALKVNAVYRKGEINRASAQAANADVAENIRTTYKLKHSYVSAYARTGDSFCAPSTVVGKVAIQISFGSVTPEVAEKIMAFAKSLEA